MKILNKILCLCVVVASFNSCDDYEGTDQLTDNRPTATTPTASLTLVEGEAGQMVTITLSEPTTRESEFRVELVNDSALAELDSDLEHIGSDDSPIDGFQAVIPALETSVTFEISALADNISEGVEEKMLRIVANRGQHAFIPEGGLLIPVTITNVTNFIMDFAWDTYGPINIGGTDYGICPNSDVDIYIADAAGFDINNAFANDLGIYDAATGACPEQIVLTEGQIPDGDYVLFSDLWTNAFAGAGSTTSFAITTTFRKDDLLEVTLEQDPSQAYNANTPAGSFNGIVAKLNINNGVYTISDSNDVVIASGKNANNGPVNRPSHITKRKNAL